MSIKMTSNVLHILTENVKSTVLVNLDIFRSKYKSCWKVIKCTSCVKSYCDGLMILKITIWKSESNLSTLLFPDQQIRIDFFSCLYQKNISTKSTTDNIPLVNSTYLLERGLNKPDKCVSISWVSAVFVRRHGWPYCSVLTRRVCSEV